MLYSPYIAAVLSLLLIALSLNISRLRLVHKVSFGDGGIKELTWAIRAHGNSLEQAVVFTLLIYFVETAAEAGATAVLALGAAFVLARILYCLALFTRRLLVRQLAHALTQLLQIAAALIILAN
ncbi:MAPEG family protein [Pseudomonas sp. 2FE]|uniref:MAPEG family protein n=1 Tax=Pseudomonas sp. 2FE TaxID=2502190 RepID=UPI001C499BAF|nr:MAPEG family protein [Pseudomonas sp. 2FE]